MRLALIALFLAAPAGASADDLPMPPSDCPGGSRGHSEHAGTWCTPTTCSSDADCAITQEVCREIGLCVATEEYAEGGNVQTPRTLSRRVAHGACVSGRCPGAGECEVARRCTPAARGGAPVEAEEDGGCTVGHGASRAPLLALALIMWTNGSRRRRRSRGSSTRGPRS